jgi:hypothetical protein
MGSRGDFRQHVTPADQDARSGTARTFLYLIAKCSLFDLSTVPHPEAAFEIDAAFPIAVR